MQPSERSRENARKAEITVFSNLFLEVASHYFSHILFVKSRLPDQIHTEEKIIQ